MDCSRLRILAVLLAATPCVAQQSSSPRLPPSEELKAAAAPLQAARAQPDDMTEADLFALSAGIAHAHHACLQLEPTLAELTSTPDELLAFASLCSFGQQWKSARRAAETYLQLPAPPDREKALLLLAQAFLGLNSPVDAAAQIVIVERDFPYDAQIEFAADQVILAGTLFSDKANSSVLGLCNLELKYALPALEKGEGIHGKEGNASPALLFTDAVRCLTTAHFLKDPSELTTLPRLQNILRQPQWQHSAGAASMQTSLARAEMVDKPAPITSISGNFLRAVGPLRPTAVSLVHGTTILLPYTLWSPSTLPVVVDLHGTTMDHEIYLLTSWAANSGDADHESKELLASLRSVAKKLPDHVSMLVVPDAVLQKFQADTFPAVVIVRDGIVKANLPLVGDAGKRLAVLASYPLESETRNRIAPHKSPHK